MFAAAIFRLRFNPVSGFNRNRTTDSAGHYLFTNIPLNPYHITVTGSGLSSIATDVQIGSTVPVTFNESLKVGTSSTVVNVEAEDILENSSVFHTDLDRFNFVDPYLRVILGYMGVTEVNIHTAGGTPAIVRKPPPREDFLAPHLSSVEH